MTVGRVARFGWNFAFLAGKRLSPGTKIDFAEYRPTGGNASHCVTVCQITTKFSKNDDDVDSEFDFIVFYFIHDFSLIIC